MGVVVSHSKRLLLVNEKYVVKTIVQLGAVVASPAPAIELVKETTQGVGNRMIVVCVKVGLPFLCLSCCSIRN